MKFKNIILILLPLVFVAFGFYLKSNDEGEEILLRAITENLNNYHYNPVSLDDEFSKKAFVLYLDNIDPNKRMLLQSDIDELKAHELLIDDQTREGNYAFFDLSCEILDKRMKLTGGFFEEILADPFDFSIDETANFDEKQSYAANEEELKDRWRQYLKYNVLTRIYSDVQAQEKAAEEQDTAVVILPFDSLEYKARKSVLRTHTDWYKRLNRLERKDRLAVYVNSLTRVYDPHTNYFPAKDKENFDIQMSGRLEGIGAQLQEKDGYIKITNIIAGGPASLQGELKENDLILKVTQEGEEPVEIIDWRIDDAVKLIRGKKGSKVTLTVRKPDGSVKNITITRDVVILEETYAKSLIIHDQDDKKAGYIFLPSFYADFQHPGGRFSWKDVKAELEKLKTEEVSGIILDLRNNGGGSLDDVVKIAGQFIDQGPIVQIKEKDQPAQILRDTRSGADWDGPLVIMINEFSASASEIMAAAMQDYHRAVIVGAASTHGKGTVQRFLSLNQTLRSKNIPDLGSIKLTTQKFYRINGDATQLKGVSSDILLPDFYMYLETGEKEHEYPMAWDQISSSDYDAKHYSIPSKLIIKSNKRVKENVVFTLIEENAKRWEDERNNNVYTLNFEKYKSEQIDYKRRNEKYENLMKDPIEGFVALNPSQDTMHIASDESRKKRNQDWVNSIVKDPYIHEALQIVEDWL